MSGVKYVDDLYNARVKYFQDGTSQVSLFPFARDRHPEMRKREVRAETTEEQAILNRNQSMERVFDICRNNTFDWFITMTFSEDKMRDRYDYDEYTKLMGAFTRKLKRWGCEYVIVPELHPTSGAIHAHGVVAGQLPTIRAVNPHTGEPLVDKFGRPVYNIPIYKYGFTTATRPDNQAAVSHYIAAYISKTVDWLPKGKKCYWASRSLERPVVCHDYLDQSDFADYAASSTYMRACPSKVGTYFFAERGGQGGQAEVNKIKMSDSSMEPAAWIEVEDIPGMEDFV